MGTVPAPSRAHAQIDELTHWVTSHDAHAAAASDLARMGLPHDPLRVEDLLGQVFEKVWSHLRRTPIDGSVPAYTRAAITNAARDLLRGRPEVSLDDLLAEGLEPEPAPPADLPTEIDGPLDDLRRALHHLITAPRVKPWRVSASLVVVVLSQDDIPLPPDIPRPAPVKGGAAKGELWAALAYAGQDRCFADPDIPAVRERRSQAIKQVEATLGRALAAVHAEEST